MRIFLIITALLTVSAQVPVLFIPGFSASHPTNVVDFLFHRGYPPQLLKLSPSYATTVKALEAAGYVEGKTFFGAVYDWRMAAAPTDKSPDGFLENLTGHVLMDNKYRYAINYLGYWLRQAVIANPGLREVDVVTHSTGGMLARAYIQSPAYGATIDGMRLPTIRKLILGACPNFGAIHSWRPWNGDYQDVLSGFIPTTEIEGRLAALVFASLRLNTTVVGPDYDITYSSILKKDKDGQLVADGTTFFRFYVPMRRSLMATNNFLIPLGSTRPTNVNRDPQVRSDLLIDLNAGSNAWLLRVGKAFATFATGARNHTGLVDFLIPGAINKNPYIATLTTVKQVSQGDYLPLVELLKLHPQPIPTTLSRFPRIPDEETVEVLNGDGNGDVATLFGHFHGEDAITLVKWGNGPPPLGLSPKLVWTHQTDWPVYHDVFFFNRDVAAFVVTVLTGQATAPIQSNLTDLAQSIFTKIF